MSYTPFEREMLKEQKRTNDLLELLVMAHQPMKLVTGAVPSDTSAEVMRDFEARLNTAHQLAVATEAGQVPIEQALAAAGILPMSAAHQQALRPGQPETPEQRAERFAARAKEVGLPEERVAEVSGRVALDLDNLTRPGIVGVQTDGDGNLLVDIVSNPPAPAKKAPAKRSKPAG